MMRRIPTQWRKILLALLSFMIWAQAVPGHALTFWDDFDSSPIVNTNLWGLSTDLTTGGAGVGVPESLQLIDDLLGLLFPGAPTSGKLLIGRHLVINQGGSTAGVDRFEYRVTNPAVKSGIQAKVAVRVCVAVDGTTVARVRGFAFGDGSQVSGPGDISGDVFALLRLICAATGQLQISWEVRQCLDSACNSQMVLGTGSFGPANLNQEYTLHVQRVGNAVVFTVDNQPQQQFVSPVTGPLKGANWFIGTRMQANFPTNGAQLAVVATFDDVFVDP